MNNSVNFCGTMKITKGMMCYNKGLSEKAINELEEIGLSKARGKDDQLDGTPVLNTDNINAINDMGIEYCLPKSNENVLLRFSNLKLKQPDFDSFLLAYNSVKDNDVHVDVNA